VPDVVDLDTGAILNDIEERLKMPALRRAEREQLEHERAQWIQTLDVHGGLTEDLVRMRREFFPEHGPALRALAEERDALIRERVSAQSAVQREIDFLRGKLDQLDAGERPAAPQQTADDLGFGSPADMAKALEAAEFDRLIRTVRENAPSERRTATGSAMLEPDPLTIDAIDRQARALIAGTPTGRTVVSATAKTLGEGLSLPELRKTAMEHYRNSLEGTTVRNEATGRVIIFDGSGRRRSVTGKGSDLLHLVTELPELLRTARPEGPPMPDARERADIVAIHRFRASAALDRNNFDVILTVRERKDGNYHYTLNKDRDGGAGGEAEAPRPEPPEGGKDTDLEVSAGPLNMDRVPSKDNALPNGLVREHERADEAVSEAEAITGCITKGTKK
jgi:hypothetical protein